MVIEYFDVKSDVKQSDTLSPLWISLFINVLDMNSEQCGVKAGIESAKLTVLRKQCSLLLYGDHTCHLNLSWL